MLNVNTATKNAYLGDSRHKTIRVVFPDLNLEYTNDDLVSQSMELTESLCEGDIEFVGCISSQFVITIRNLTDDVKNHAVNVYISATGTGVTEIPLFKGYVAEVELAAEKRHKRIKAYDILHTLSQIDVALWYTGLTFPITLANLRNSLFSHLEITQETATLPNDSVSIIRRYNPETLCALDVIKSLCQINGVFGKINRSGNFEYVNPTSESTQDLSYYKNASYQEFTVKPASKVIVRYDDIEGGYGGGANTYIIQNNIFTNGFKQPELQEIAQNIYNNVSGFSYQPFECDINGLPYLECLDTLTMSVADLESQEMQTKSFIVLSRKLSGIQSIRDYCSAEGDEYQHIFTSNVGTQINELKRQIEILRSNMDNLEFAYYLISNTSDITITDGNTSTIIDMYFSAKKESVVTFNCEILLDAETKVNGINYYDAKAELRYYLNEIIVGDYYPTETWQDGKHILNLYYYFVIQDSGRRRFRVTLKMTGGSISIKSANLKGAIYGQNLDASDDWNGIIRVNQTVSGIPIPQLTVAAGVDTVTHSEIVDNATRLLENGDTRITENGDTRITG